MEILSNKHGLAAHDLENCAHTQSVSATTLSLGEGRGEGCSRRAIHNTETASAISLSQGERAEFRLEARSVSEQPKVRNSGEGVKQRAAFTLAEVLVALGVIVVVAAMTIPTLVARINDKVTENQNKVFQAKLIKAFAYEVETKAKTESLNNLP